MSNNAHPTAIISPKAQLGNNNLIGPYVVIEDDVVIGDNNSFASGVVIKDGSRIGNNNTLHEHAVIAGVPQDLGFKGQTSYVSMGNENIIREGVTINRSSREEHVTKLGNNNFLMTQSHVGHDCCLGDDVILVTGAGLGGFVTVEDKVFISGGVMVHQFVTIGTFAMVGGNAKITQNVLPYMITDGVPAYVRGLNLVGLKRGGFQRAETGLLKEAFRILFHTSGLALKEVLLELENLGSESASHLAEFIKTSKRGFHRVRSQSE